MKIRVIQLIDSLEAGGAERMAVSLANELEEYIEDSFICATRKEGILKNSIKVPCLFLKKRKILDIKSLRKLRSYIIHNKITHIHAHSSSFFLAFLIKVTLPKIKIVWHDHYGNSENLSNRSYRALYFASFFFDSIISVNQKLKDWSEKKLLCKKVYFINNFISEKTETISKIVFSEDKTTKIVCLANIRPQKDHITLFRSFKELREINKNVSLHLIGDYTNEDNYYKVLVNYCKKHKLEAHITFYGSLHISSALLKLFDIGVLSSKSEGLPLALLEYGLAELPVVCTDVGECGSVLQDRGILIEAGDYKNLSKSFQELIRDKNKQKQYAFKHYNFVSKEYSAKSIVPQFVNIYNH